MKHGITAVLAAAALAAAASAQARTTSTGFYAGAGVGSFNLDIDNPDDVEDDHRRATRATTRPGKHSAAGA